jgi:hypothetical protein
MPDKSFPVGKLVTVSAEIVRERRKDLWIGHVLIGIPLGNLKSHFGSA